MEITFNKRIKVDTVNFDELTGRELIIATNKDTHNTVGPVVLVGNYYKILMVSINQYVHVPEALFIANLQQFLEVMSKYHTFKVVGYVAAI